jgi:hypothetical protein
MKISFLLIPFLLLLFYSCDKATDTGEDTNPGKPIIAWVGNADGDFKGDIYIWDGNKTTQLTNNQVNLLPIMDGSNIIWTGAENDSGFFEIFFYTTDTIIQLSKRRYAGFDISGNNVIWDETVGFQMICDIFIWDGSSTKKITSSDMFNHGPFISGDNAAWLGHDSAGGFNEIYYWNGQSITQVTDSGNGGLTRPIISGSNLVWVDYSTNIYKLMFWDGNSTQQIFESDINIRSYQIYNNNVAWLGFHSTGPALYFWNGSSTTKITDLVNEDCFFNIYENKVVWSISDGNDDEIFLWDGSTITQITDNNFNEGYVRISGDNIVWMGRNGNDYEIFFWDGNTITQITDNDVNDVYPCISK